MILEKILEFIFPKRCLECGESGSYVCGNCHKELRLLEHQQCPKCRTFSADGRFCTDGCGKFFYLDQLIVCFKYEQLVRKIICQFKYKFSKELKILLGDFLKQELGNIKLNVANFLITPVPLSKNRFNFRGFNQAKLLTEQIGGGLDILERIRHCPPQATLSFRERIVNLRDAFIVKNSDEIKNKKILLIDDVATTLSTLNECSKVLKNAGAKYVAGMVLARG